MQRVVHTILGAVYGAILCLAAAPAFAGTPVLSDPLTNWPLNLGPQGASVHMENGAVHITAPANGAGWVTYSGFDFTDMDASVTVAPNNGNGNACGLLFWSTGPSDFFDFAISDTAGTFGVFKHVSTPAPHWETIVPYTKTSLVKSGAPNTLRLVTKGNYVTLYINGQSAGALSLPAPQGGGAVGFEGEGNASGASDYTVSNLSVSQP
ncbi:MAG: hypothetical protein ACLPJJ_00455 [Acidocella sp.]|uniref:hypothetical protein n=1 Tax=Acidocella sp. TaxID=50710 RepID=UPI003FC6CCC4